MRSKRTHTPHKPIGAEIELDVSSPLVPTHGGDQGEIDTTPNELTLTLTPCSHHTVMRHP
ncbi:hypothetical protein GCM10009529_12930 [Micropruina glycogenica]